MGAARPSIAVIGAGFSGLMCAIHLLLKSVPNGPRIYLIEQNPTFGVGGSLRHGKRAAPAEHPRRQYERLSGRPRSFP